MKINIKVTKEVEIKFLEIIAKVRCWENTTVNEVGDTEGKLIPCRVGDTWNPLINIDSGRILNWEQGKAAKIHYKVCDAGEYLLRNETEIVVEHQGYVRNIACPAEIGYGDYIIMNIDEDGQIANWNADVSDFFENE